MSPRKASFSVVLPVLDAEPDDVPLAVDPADGVELELLLPPQAAAATITTAQVANNHRLIMISSK
jgi:hypothetical protein